MEGAGALKSYSSKRLDSDEPILVLDRKTGISLQVIQVYARPRLRCWFQGTAVLPDRCLSHSMILCKIQNIELYI